LSDADEVLAADALPADSPAATPSSTRIAVFTARAPTILLDASLDRLMIADTTPLPASSPLVQGLGDLLTVVSGAPLLGEAIRRRHLNLSITELLENGP
jgi:phosphoribosylpyrophosphate synthetase